MKTNLDLQSIARAIMTERQKVLDTNQFGITGDYQKTDAVEGNKIHETRIFKARTSAEAREMALLDGLTDAGYLLN